MGRIFVVNTTNAWHNPSSRYMIGLCTTFDNCMKVVKALEDNGCKVLGIVAIFDYGFPSTYDKLNKEGIDLTSLTTLDIVLHHAENMGVIDSEQSNSLKNWQQQPSTWNK